MLGIFRRIKHAVNAGCFAIGMDIDHIFGEQGLDVVIGEQMAVKTSAMIRKYVESTRLPFFVKGVLSVEDAVKCAKKSA